MFYGYKNGLNYRKKKKNLASRKHVFFSSFTMALEFLNIARVVSVLNGKNRIFMFLRIFLACISAIKM